MDSRNIYFVLCLVIFLVVGINAALYAALRKKNGVGQIELLRRASQRAIHPWGDEEEALDELAKRVADLKNRNVTQNENPKSKT